MRLLMITRKVDPNEHLAGFVYTWVKKLGAKLDKLYVITWQESKKGNLGENIEIFSLPKSKIKKVFVLQKLLWRILPKTDGLFCHMNPEYTILSAGIAKVFRKRIITWYTHGSVTWKLKLVNLLADKIVTASKQSCRLKNRKKIQVIGHGIDIEFFKAQHQTSNIKHQMFNILSIGRISPTKNYQILIEAIEILVKQKSFNNLKLKIIGAPGLLEQEKYFNQIKQLVKDKKLEKYIQFLGAIPNKEILPYYQQADLFINLSQTGSIDKTVLEAMACECLVLTSNQAFKNILFERLFLENKQAENLAERIKDLYELGEEEKEKIKKSLREKVIQDFNLDNLVEKIIKQFK